MKIVMGDSDIERFRAVVAELRQRFKTHPDLGTNSCAPTGEPYEVISSYGTGAVVGGNLRFPTARPAIAAWHKHLLAYCADRRGVLYWRLMPVLEAQPVDAGFKYQVFSRLLISDRAHRQGMDTALGRALQGPRCVPALFHTLYTAP